MSGPDLTPVICLIALIALTLWTLRQVKVFHSAPKTRERLTQRLSDREMELVGDDYRDHVAPYFRKVSIRRQIVRDITGAK
jgi:hypothetical protein